MAGRRGAHGQDAWRKARLAIEHNRPRAAAAAVEMAAPDALPQLAELNTSPSRFLTGRDLVASRARKEMVVLALIKLAGTDPENAARQLDSKWGPQLAPEERNWVWGVIGKHAAQHGWATAMRWPSMPRSIGTPTSPNDMLAWKARAALRAPRSAVGGARRPSTP